MVSLTNLKPQDKSKEFNYFMGQFPGHSTMVGCTELGIFTNYPESDYNTLKELNDLGHSIYFTVNETSPSGRTMQDLESIRAVFADDDKLREYPIKFPLQPSIIVQTSEHDGKFKHQYYWLTSTEDYEVWERVLLGIIGVYETDANVHDLARILRVPGFMNHKYDSPTPAKMIFCSGTVYKWGTILESFPPLPNDKVREIEAKSTEGEINLQELMNRFKNPDKPGWITNSLNSLIMHWAWHYSAKKIDQMINDLMRDVDPETLSKHSARYFAAHSQVAKFVKSAKEEVQRAKAQESRTKSEEYNVVNMYDEVPLDLTWDWSVLKSNEFPEECLPKYLLDAAAEVGEWNGVGKDPAVVSAMAITSALLNKNVIIHETFDQLTHFCAQGTIIVMDTGASKSSIYEAMNQPFFDYENKLHEEWDKIKFTNQHMVKALEMEIKNRDSTYNKGNKEHTDAEMMSHAGRQGELQAKIDRIPIKSPTLHTNDITEETTFRKLTENNGTIALISDDARKPINILLGEYKKGNETGEAIYINGFSGTSITRERSSGDEQRVQKPALNCLYFVQPDTAIKLRDSDMYVPSGLAARMPMFFYPTNGVDIIRNRQRRDIDHVKMSPYYEHLRAICLNRSDNPLHIRLTDEGMRRCKEFDLQFAEMLETEWHGEFSKLNKFVSTALQYATCIAALDDPEFKHKYQNPTRDSNDYYLSIKYMNMGYMYSRVLFQQSVVTQNSVDEEGIPRKAKKLINVLQKMYDSGKIYEGFVNQGDFRNSISVTYRDDLPSLIDFLLAKRWIFATKHQGVKRKLNAGFPNKLVEEGDMVLHLNVRGINKRTAMKLNTIEDRTDG